MSEKDQTRNGQKTWRKMKILFSSQATPHPGVY